jgi:O-acetyl-ADP-ribose deacetylase (regulator of RNase III)
MSEKLLTSAIFSTIALAIELGLESVAIPAISSGIFGYPKGDVARIMFKCARVISASEFH